MYRFSFSAIVVVVMAVLVVFPIAGQAKDLEVISRNDGGVDVEFPNGCFINYDRYGNRGGHRNRCKNKQFERADEAVRNHMNIHGNTSGDSVSQSQMQRYCQGEASAKLDVRPNYILTLPVERSGSHYIVYGQSPTSGSNVTTFECIFNQHGVFRDVEVTRWANDSGGSSSGDSVPEAQMQRYCQGEASAELDVRPNYISTFPVERSGNHYVVYGQSPPSGSNVTIFECKFNRHGVFRGVEVTRWANQGGNNSSSNELPSQARKKCLDSFGGSAKVTQVSALRPGYWEVIMQNNAGSRMAACTVSSDGHIQDWAEMN